MNKLINNAVFGKYKKNIKKKIKKHIKIRKYKKTY